ncbi:MAG: glycerophosphodiester phosphodiesterase family protein [Candidatus Gracilibacteria bacterium]
MLSRSILKKIYIAFGTLLGILLCLLGYLLFPYTLPAASGEFTLIAHRGVHQTFPLDGLENDTCTASIMNTPTHEYLENTIPSIRKAFESGANIVEIDIHPTTDNRLAVFHDWTIDCRTNGKGVTREQSMEYLKTLDIGYGYTADGGKTFPMRGKGIGMMPTIEEVLDAFPGKKFAVNQKDTFDRTTDLLASVLEKYPVNTRENIYYYTATKQYELLKAKTPEVKKDMPTRGEEKACIPEYLGMLFTGKVTENCRRYIMGIPARYLIYAPGWPNLFLMRARQADLKVYIIDVDSREEYEYLRSLPIDGITTNKIELMDSFE